MNELDLYVDTCMIQKYLEKNSKSRNIFIMIELMQKSQKQNYIFYLRFFLPSCFLPLDYFIMEYVIFWSLNLFIFTFLPTLKKLRYN